MRTARAASPVDGVSLSRPVCWRSANAIVRWKRSGATPPSADHATTSGWWGFSDARSPSAITASTGRWSLAAAAAAPPPSPLVEMNVSVRRSGPWASTRASSSITAVPDSCARAPTPSAARSATTTICPPWPASRVPITVRTVRSPSTVWVVVFSVRTR